MIRALWQQSDSLTMRNGVLYRLFFDKTGIIQCYQLILLTEMKLHFWNLSTLMWRGTSSLPNVFRI